MVNPDEAVFFITFYEATKISKGGWVAKVWMGAA